jgi:hypothetical protein
MDFKNTEQKAIIQITHREGQGEFAFLPVAIWPAFVGVRFASPQSMRAKSFSSSAART